MSERWRIMVEGIVQGVGFRPFVYRLATTRHLAGFVRNSTTGVIIEAEGEHYALGAFLQALRQEPPALVVIARVTHAVVPPTGEKAFTIVSSQTAQERRVFVPPDVCTCDACLQELFDPSNRRYRYPFINCTHCGPRWTIIQDVPYDRERTTMAVFRMCPDCRDEYGTPTNRRFHAQPNACPQCGPRLRLFDNAGGEMASVDPLRHITALLRDGAIVAVKGLGGYHLACDAGNNTVVRRLRRTKHLEEKPFALMVQDMEAVQRLCEVGEAEAMLLRSYQRPIVLLRKRHPTPVACMLAPDSHYLGVMLPYTPLHHLLLREAQRPLVMTSGNLSAQPIVYQDEEALHRLRTVADYFLLHNRDIHVRCDDSVTRVVRGQALTQRRSRGYVPQPLTMPFLCRAHPGLWGAA
jgi:hydrogenase maturation protein HypF